MVYTDELRRLTPSAKCPDRFSRSVACSAKPESFLEAVPLEKVEDIGEGATGDGGECPDEPVLVELVDGLSLPLLVSLRGCKNALNTVVFVCGTVDASPNVVELSLTYAANVAGFARELKICEFSDENAS